MTRGALPQVSARPDLGFQRLRRLRRAVSVKLLALGMCRYPSFPFARGPTDPLPAAAS